MDTIVDTTKVSIVSPKKNEELKIEEHKIIPDEFVGLNEIELKYSKNHLKIKK